jgi:formate dehydrogenase major subunit
MTNHWIDIGNADVILIMGSNPAENHPISFRWINRAVEKGAKVICVDPRFTRSAERAHIYARLRSGTDIAFLGGMINYILENNLIQKEYVVEYTNAAFLVDPGFGFKDGVFTGYNSETRKYDKSTWKYQLDENEIPKRDPSLQDPHCVYQLLKQHFSRYFPDIVSDITGTPKQDLLKVYEVYTGTGKPDKAGTILYAMGWTQHTVGVQNIRAMAIIQQLLGNMGVAGGGVNALRGESNVQGSTDYGLLFHILPGYNPVPRSSVKSLKDYIEKYTPKTKDPKAANWLQNRSKYIVSFLRAMYGAKATAENDFCYEWLPKPDDGQNASWLVLFDQMSKGKFTGFFAWGQNPACSGADANKTRRAMGNLDWMVNVNLFDNETGSFWKGPGMDPAKIKTEVFMLPCAASFEKEGSITNSGRWMQWRYKAVDPPGEAKPDLEIIHELFQKVRALYKQEGGAFPDPIVNLSWNYGLKGPDGLIKHPDPHLVAKEINGYTEKDIEQEPPKTPQKGPAVKPGEPKKIVAKAGEQLGSFALLKDDGSTVSGNWIYCGSYTQKGNMAARRNRSDPAGIGLFPEWTWCWPVNRRIIYNRAAVDKEGKPWDMKRPVIWWDGTKWFGDVTDGSQPPGSVHPFTMVPEGRSRIFGPGLADGPFPEHYEPMECPLGINLLSPTLFNPTVPLVIVEQEKLGATAEKYPIVCSTYRVTEHWQTGVMTRNTPWLLEMQPQLFVEMSHELAKEKGIKNGEWVIVKSKRGQVEGKAILTRRLRPFQIAERTVHLAGLPWHYGWLTPDAGDSANLLTSAIGDPNTMIPETKVFMVDITKKGGK